LSCDPKSNFLGTNCNVFMVIDWDFHVGEISLESWFLKNDERELENLNKEGCKVDKHAKL